MQSLARSLRLPAGAAHGIGSESGELGQAEQRFRRALEREPAFTEARIRLGRVLHLRGRHEEAARELQRAAAALSVEPLDGGRRRPARRYYAEMFLGAASEALGTTRRGAHRHTRGRPSSIPARPRLSSR